MWFTASWKLVQIMSINYAIYPLLWNCYFIYKIYIIYILPYKFSLNQIHCWQAESLVTTRVWLSRGPVQGGRIGTALGHTQEGGGRNVAQPWWEQGGKIGPVLGHTHAAWEGWSSAGPHAGGRRQVGGPWIWEILPCSVPAWFTKHLAALACSIYLMVRLWKFFCTKGCKHFMTNSHRVSI